MLVHGFVTLSNSPHCLMSQKSFQGFPDLFLRCPLLPPQLPPSTASRMPAGFIRPRFDRRSLALESHYTIPGEEGRTWVKGQMSRRYRLWIEAGVPYFFASPSRPAVHLIHRCIRPRRSIEFMM